MSAAPAAILCQGLEATPPSPEESRAVVPPTYFCAPWEPPPPSAAVMASNAEPRLATGTHALSRAGRCRVSVVHTYSAPPAGAAPSPQATAGFAGDPPATRCRHARTGSCV